MSMNAVSLAEERRRKFRKKCTPRPIDLYSVDDDVEFYEFEVIDESPNGGLGCVGEKNDPPDVDTILDWCGLKRYNVCWVKELEDGKKFQVGLKPM